MKRSNILGVVYGLFIYLGGLFVVLFWFSVLRILGPRDANGVSYMRAVSDAGIFSISGLVYLSLLGWLTYYAASICAKRSLDSSRQRPMLFGWLFVIPALFASAVVIGATKVGEVIILTVIILMSFGIGFNREQVTCSNDE